MIECKFTKQSRDIVEEFLQSVVVVDDYARLDPLVTSEASKEVITPPSERPEIGIQDTSGQSAKDKHTEKEVHEIPENKPYEDPAEGRFNAKQVIGSFAEKGINCAVLEPADQSELDTLPNTISKLAITSDVIILDWALGDTGGNTQKLIQNLVYHDEENRDRLRLIAIYTIDNRVLLILDEIKTGIEAIKNGPKLKKNESDYSLLTGSTKIIALLKEAAKVPKENPELANRKVPFSKLADRIIDEFTEMTHGLVPNMALQSMSEIRKNTSRILKYYNKELDIPYLAHRSLLDDPADAEEHIVELLSADLKAILEEAGVKRHVNLERLVEWVNLKEILKQEFPFTKGDGKVIKLTKEQVIEILKKGIKNAELGLTGQDKVKQNKNPQDLPLSQVFSGHDTTNHIEEELFANITSFRTFFKKIIPSLTLGTVVQDEHDNYLVCIQPRCDCVRIDNATNFLFLPLELKADGIGFDLVIKDNGEYKRTKIKKKVISIVQVVFKGDTSRTVTATEDHLNYYFIAVSLNDRESAKRYKWVGELRLERAISLSNDFAAELARVGFTQSEWLRLHAKKQ